MTHRPRGVGALPRPLLEPLSSASREPHRREDAFCSISDLFRRAAVAAFAAALALALSSCGRAPSPYGPAQPSAEPTAEQTYPQAESRMIALGQSIDSAWGLQTTPDTWLSIQAENCRIAQSLGSTPPTAVDWFVPTQETAATQSDPDGLITASVATSLITGCPDTINPRWDWPRFWVFLQRIESAG